jgi:hypothetical protein
MPADRLLHPRLLHSEKVTSLSHTDFRVWLTYQLTADDYGVMRKSAMTIQASCDALAGEKSKAIDASLDRIVACGLVKKFEHQGRTYVYQSDWQNFQRVKHPRDTMQPLPPDDVIASCSSATRKLFAQHPSKKAKESENDLGQISATLPEDSGNGSDIVREPLSGNGSLACARTREMATGSRLTANGTEGVQGDWPPMDEWARELVNLYPAQGRCGAAIIERPLHAALTEDRSVGVREAWEALKGRLAQQRESAQWQAGKIPRLDRWLREGLHLQVLPATRRDETGQA